MTDYTKNTNFTAKDSLLTGDPNKKIKGSEFDGEFDEIATASATKANKQVPGVTGDFAALSATGDLTDSGKTPPDGAVVGTTDTQTLDDKDLTNVRGLTAANNLDIGSYNLRAETLQSDVVTGTAPLTVASTTVVPNLNADQVDGKEPGNSSGSIALNNQTVNTDLYANAALNSPITGETIAIRYAKLTISQTAAVSGTWYTADATCTTIDSEWQDFLGIVAYKTVGSALIEVEVKEDIVSGLGNGSSREGAGANGDIVGIGAPSSGDIKYGIRHNHTGTPDIDAEIIIAYSVATKFTV